MAALAYVDRRGVIGFGTGHAPRNMMVFARHHDIQQLRAIVDVYASHDLDRQLVVPGVRDAADEAAARAALDIWRDWSFPHYRVSHGAVLITDDVEAAP